MKTTTFLTFVGDQCGKGTEAINFYTSIFPNSEIKKVIKYDEGEGGGTPELIKYGEFSLNGVDYKISESNYNHAWSFSPGVSIFIESDSEVEIKNLFESLSANGGKILMPLDKYESGDYGFGKKYGWCEDQYGISWQLILL